MLGSRNQEVFGIFLAVLGILFLLVNNGLLWFGWEALWPAIPFLIGAFLLIVYTRRRRPRQLFLGTFLVLFGAFFSLFSTGILAWDAMDRLWPTIPLIVGASLFVLTVAGAEGPPLIFGIVLVVFATVGFLAESDVIEPRVSQPFVRIWPLVLVAAGILIFLRGKRERLQSEPISPASTGPESESP
ncbi:MAG: hypothetical protein OEN01_03705 [Candidatus Krumholzibacteria bacterium]|nr:hypothetical protein [Candidatus Krumholzibacteria bacterium]